MGRSCLGICERLSQLGKPVHVADCSARLGGRSGRSDNAGVMQVIQSISASSYKHTLMLGAKAT